MNQKIAKLKKEIELSDTSYKQAVVRLDETRIKWEEEMANCCVSFENFELTRINKLREHLTEYIVLEDKVIFFFFEKSKKKFKFNFNFNSNFNK